MRHSWIDPRPARIHWKDPRLLLCPAEPDILPQHGERLAPVLDEARPRRAPRQCLEPERAGAGKEIEHLRFTDRIAIAPRQHVKDCLAHPIGGGAQMRRRIALAKNGERPPAMRPADDPHDRSNAFRSTRASTTIAGSALIPASISRLPTI